MRERAQPQRRPVWLYATLAAVVLLLCGIGIGWLAFGSARTASSTRKPAAQDVGATEHPAPQTLNVVNRTEIDPEQLREQVTLAVGQALDARLAALPVANSPAASAAATAEEDPPLSATNIEAFDAAQAVLAKGIASHRWTRASRQDLHSALIGATHEQRLQIRGELMKRFASGEIQYDPEGE